MLILNKLIRNKLKYKNPCHGLIIDENQRKERLSEGQNHSKICRNTRSFRIINYNLKLLKKSDDKINFYNKIKTFFW